MTPLSKFQQAYVEQLYSATSFGYCAGKVTELPKLHKNRIISTVESCWSLGGLRNCLKRLGKNHQNNGYQELMNNILSFIDSIYKEYKDWFDLDPWTGIQNQSMRDALREDSGDIDQLQGIVFAIRALIRQNNLTYDEITDLMNDDLKYFFAHVVKEDYDILETVGGNENVGMGYEMRKQVIFGNPGDGKTIALRQLCHSQCDQILDGEDRPLPIFIKAKELATIWSNSEDLKKRWMQNSTETALSDLINAALKSEDGKSINRNNMVDLFTSMDNLHYHSVLLIDAWDECSSDELDNLQEFFTHPDISLIRKIITCRNSHREHIENLFNNEYHELKMTFSGEELKEIMPRKLADAWGMNADLMQFEFDEFLPSYEKVLTHPLFVGLFCLLMSNGNIVHKKKSDSKFSEELTMNGYNLAHIEFLDKVIEIGLDINIDDRVKDLTKSSKEKIKHAFILICGLHEFNRIFNLNKAIQVLRESFSIDLQQEEVKVIRENLGLLFVGEENIQFTHKTIKETACAKLLLENQTFYDILKSKRHTGMKFRREGFAECVILGMVYYKNQENKLGILDNFTSLLSEWGRGIASTMLADLDIKREPIFSRITQDRRTKKGSKYTGTFETNSPLLQKIGLEYFKNIDYNQLPHSKFPLPFWALQGLDSRSLTDVFGKLQHVPLNTTNGEHSVYFREFPNLHLKDFIQLRVHDEGWNRHSDYERWLGTYQDKIINWFVDIETDPFTKKVDHRLREQWIKDISLYIQQSILRIKSGKNINFDPRPKSHTELDYISNKIKSIKKWIQFVNTENIPINTFERTLPEEILDLFCNLMYDKNYSETIEYAHDLWLKYPEDGEWEKFEVSLEPVGLGWDGWMFNEEGDGFLDEKWISVLFEHAIHTMSDIASKQMLNIKLMEFDKGYDAQSLFKPKDFNILSEEQFEVFISIMKLYILIKPTSFGHTMTWGYISKFLT